jgi:hypothetical protein
MHDLHAEIVQRTVPANCLVCIVTAGAVRRSSSTIGVSTSGGQMTDTQIPRPALDTQGAGEPDDAELRRAVRGVAWLLTTPAIDATSARCPPPICGSTAAAKFRLP